MKPVDVDEILNRRIIISELGSSLNNDDAIYASVVTKAETEASAVSEVSQ